jgi:hypothetical protein
MNGMKNNTRTVSIALSFFIWTIFSSCMNDGFNKDEYGNCSDKIQNQREEGVDCGGPCMGCASCNDGVKNSLETGIDCGGACETCAPNCSLTAESITYTLFPAGFSSGYENSQTLSGKGLYSPSTIKIDFSGGSSTGFIRMSLEFMNGFNPISYIPLNETMVFRTLQSTTTINQKSGVIVTYYGNFGSSGFNGALSPDQPVYITKVSSSDVLIRFCSLKANKDFISLAASAR